MARRSGTRTSARSRMAQLLFALTDEPSWVSQQWLFREIPSYRAVAEDSAKRYLRDDIEALREAGIPVEQQTVGNELFRYRIADQGWLLADPGFTPAEANVIAAASQVAFGNPELDSLSKTGWSKLVPFVSADQKTPAARRTTTVVAEPVDLSSQDLNVLLQAASSPRKQVQFWYARQYGANDELRRLEPWGLASRRGRYYLVGFDLDRDAPRVFRLSRIKEVIGSELAATQPRPTAQLTDLVEQQLTGNREPVRAVVAIAEGQCRDITHRAQPAELDGHWIVDSMDRRQLVHWALAHSATVSVIEPQEIREEIRTHFEQIIATLTPTESGKA